MTTTPATDTSAGTESANTAAGAVGSGSRGEDVSRELIAKARYDAFRLMTEARAEADAILDQARAEAAGSIKASEIVAESTIARAETAAEAISLAAKEEAAAVVASALRTAGEHSQTDDSVALQVEHRTLSERVSTLRAVADQLEDRFAALARTATTPRPSKNAEPKGASPTDSEASVAPEVTSASEVSVEHSADRGSFYNRRSANLPRLGQDHGQNVNDMARMMRESLDRE